MPGATVDCGTQIVSVLVMAAREAEGRAAAPTAVAEEVLVQSASNWRGARGVAQFATTFKHTRLGRLRAAAPIVGPFAQAGFLSMAGKEAAKQSRREKIARLARPQGLRSFTLKHPYTVDICCDASREGFGPANQP
jgi:hypothetical protein